MNWAELCALPRGETAQLSKNGASSAGPVDPPPQKRGRGRPKGSLNKPKYGPDGLPVPKAPRRKHPVFGPKNRRGRPRKNPEAASPSAPIAPPEATPSAITGKDEAPEPFLFLEVDPYVSTEQDNYPEHILSPEVYSSSIFTRENYLECSHQVAHGNGKAPKYLSSEQIKDILPYGEVGLTVAIRSNSLLSDDEQIALHRSSYLPLPLSPPPSPNAWDYDEEFLMPMPRTNEALTSIFEQRALDFRVS